jgi:hypothetical protein
MNYHSNIPANRAAVNQENLFRQVAVILARGILELRQLVTCTAVNTPGCSTRREQESEKESGNQSAHVRRRADLRRGKVECDLDRDDQADVCEPLFREWRMMMSQ